MKDLICFVKPEVSVLCVIHPPFSPHLQGSLQIYSHNVLTITGNQDEGSDQFWNANKPQAMCDSFPHLPSSVMFCSILFTPFLSLVVVGFELRDFNFRITLGENMTQLYSQAFCTGGMRSTQYCFLYLHL